MIVTDASVVIAMFNQNDAYHDRAAAIVLSDDDLVLHPVTAAEVFVGPARTGLVDDVVHTLEALQFRIDVPDAGQPTRLADLRARTRLKLPDCCVLDAAMSLHAPLATFDDELARRARSVGVGVVTTATVTP